MSIIKADYHEKPFIIIFGCTGTGKTKLSIELANKFKNQAEIINADALQLYKGLNIATNKATIDEMCGIPHHLIGYLDPLCKTYTVNDYRKKAIDLIDDLLMKNKLPIIVGGTNYYIESIIWDITIDDPVDDDNDHNVGDNDVEDDDQDQHYNEMNKKNKRKEIIIDDFYKLNKDYIKNLYDSKLTNDEIYKQLELVDPQSAFKVHPNDRRKLSRALEIYYHHGVNKSELIKIKNQQSGSGLYHGPLRYKNVCIYFLNCENEILNKRLDDRVDDMINKGLLNELKTFQNDVKSKINGQSINDYSEQYQVGIFQAIGFKEFDDYLNLNENERGTEEGKKLFDKGLEEMKMVTRKYAKKQQKWMKNRFIKRSNKYSPDVYELDTSNLEKWNEVVFEKAVEIYDDFIHKREPRHKPLDKEMNDEVIFENNYCEKCKKTFINKNQWNEHINGRLHKKRIEHLKNIEKINEFKAKKELKKQQQNELKNLEKN